MSRRFFKLHDDVYAPERWQLKGPFDAMGQEPDDVWQFTSGHPVTAPGPLFMKYDIPGEPLDYSHGGVAVPIVHSRLAEVFAERAPQDVQLLPVDVEGQSDSYFILVVTRRVRCIDEEASRVRRWKPEDGVAWKVGQYRSIEDLHIDKTLVGADVQIFRPEDWEVVILVSEELKDALEHSQATGMTFKEVP